MEEVAQAISAIIIALFFIDLLFLGWVLPTEPVVDLILGA